MMYETNSFPTWRLAAVAGVVVFALVGLAVRLVYIQLINHEEYVAQARQEHRGYEEIFARRGAILDSGGYPMAISIDTYDVYIYRPVWDDAEKAAEGARILAPHLGLSAEQILAAVNEDGPAEFPIARDVDYATGELISQAEGVEGVRLQRGSKRIYPEGSLAAPLIGILGFEGTGLSGLEHDFNPLLSGNPGRREYEVDGLGNPINVDHDVLPDPGSDVTLTIDRYIQLLAEQELDETIKNHRAKGGDIIVMDVETGAILAMVSRPSFDLNSPDVSTQEKLDLLKNGPVSDLYEPGSVFKLVTAAAALNEGLVTPESTYEDTGTLKFEQWEIKNFDKSAHGTQSVVELLQKSLNTGSAWLSQLLGPELFYEYVKEFGFGEATGIGSNAEAEGHIRDWQDDSWSLVDMATNSFGQGLSATPLQVITAVAAIGNEGKLMRPYVVKEVSGTRGTKTTEAQIVSQVVTPETAETLSDIMSQVVDYSPGGGARIPGYEVAGKTGTSSIPQGNEYSESRFIASFAGFVPLSDPQFAILVKVDEPNGVPWGSAVAAPSFGRLGKKILEYMRIPPETAHVAR